MTKPTRMLGVAVIAMLIVVAGTSAALAAPRPVALGNTQATAFAPAQNCNCHSGRILEWQQSLHSKALSDPLFQTKLAETSAATNGKRGPFCLRCHAPIATMTNRLGTTDPNSSAAQGISCTFCHQVAGVGPKSVDGVALLLEPNGVYRAQVSTSTSPHPWKYSPLHASSKICAPCHNVNHLGNSLPIETTYSEWEASPQAKAGVQCQDCHMSWAPGQIGPSMGWDAGGGVRRPIYRMNFMGGQVALGNSILADGLLKSAATIKLDAPTVLEGAASKKATVTITNSGAGHYLPTGLTQVREMWLQLEFTGPDGKIVQLAKHAYGTVLKDSAGKFPADFWNATGVQSDDRIPPMGTSTQSYDLALPNGMQYGTIKAQLLYRSESDELAKKAGVVNPITVMAETSQPIYASLAVERTANGSALKEASESPMMPLVFAVSGILLSFAIIIFFVWWGRRPRVVRRRVVVPAEKKPQAEESASEHETERDVPGPPTDEDAGEPE